MQLKLKFPRALGNSVRPVGSGGLGALARSVFEQMGLIKTSDYDHEQRAGEWHDNVSLAATLKAMLRMLTDAEPCAQRRAAKSQGGKWAVDWEHDVTRLLQNPNPYMDATQLVDAIAIWYILNGNVYLYKRRSLAGKIVELYVIPPERIWPVRPADGSSEISHYDYIANPGDTPVRYETWEIIHIKNGRDPANELLGWSDVRAALRDICTENEISRFVNAMLHNCGVPNVVVSAKDNEQSKAMSQPGVMQRMQRTFRENFGGSKRGTPWFQSLPLDVKVLGYDPKSMDLSFLRQVTQSNISALIGIPAVVVGLLVGLQTSTAKASYEASLRQAYVACIIPMLKRLARQLSKGLINDPIAPFGDPAKLRVHFDLSEVQCLGEDLTALVDRTVKLWDANLMKRSQAQQSVNLEADMEEDGYKFELVKGADPAAADEPNNADGNKAHDEPESDDPEDDTSTKGATKDKEQDNE